MSLVLQVMIRNNKEEINGKKITLPNFLAGIFSLDVRLQLRIRRLYFHQDGGKTILIT